VSDIVVQLVTPPPITVDIVAPQIKVALPTGPKGAKGYTPVKGVDYFDGEPGEAATVEVGTVVTGAAGSSAKVYNAGTPQAAVFDFTIPQGEKGDKGDPSDWDSLSGKPNFGTASLHAATDFATAAQGAKADTAVQPSALGTAAAKNVDDFDPAGAAAAISLSGLGGVPTSRKIAGHTLTGDVTITAGDVGADAAGAAAAITLEGLGGVSTDDARLSDARPASDVSAWAKASTKPSYGYSEVGADPAGAAAAAALQALAISIAFS
jgi:hypothetical protein